MLFQINQILAVVTALLLIIFSIFLLTIKKERKLNRRLLFIFLVINAAYLAAYLVISTVKPVTLLTLFIFYFLHSTGFLFGPVLLLYTKSTVGTLQRISTGEMVHLIPFSCALLYVLIRYIIFGSPGEIWDQSDRMFYDLILHVQVMPYMIFSLIEIKKYGKRIRNYYSSIEKLNFYWLTIVLYGFFFMWIADFINFFLRRLFVLPSDLHATIGTLSLLTNFIFAILIFYEGLKHPQYFHFPEQLQENLNMKNPSYLRKKMPAF